MKEITLVIMAAGIGSRFGGGIKQLEPVGPNGEIIMDYSIYDALEAGFGKIVFIIRKDLEQDFKEMIGKRIEKLAPVSYVFQELSDLPAGYEVTPGRKKPWGTGQAVLCVKDVVEGPFLVINADDYYGKEGFRKIYQYLAESESRTVEPGVYDICMGGFVLSNTLSENGGVTRGVCSLREDGTLKRVQETYEIQWKDGRLVGRDGTGNPVVLDPAQRVSMNMWGLPAEFLQELERGFPEFLDSLSEGDVKSEYLLPAIIDRLIKEKKARVKVLETADQWFGVTYREDKEAVATAIRKLIAEGVYGEKL